ncbi:MAG TPA: hypothetical protein VGL57_05840 [Solirubrobacteraceae bacterium]|jgi:hypothetical protein
MTDEDPSMTDDDNLSEPSGEEPAVLPPLDAAASNGQGGARRNGTGAAGQVRSGLAHRRHPALVALGDAAQGVRKMLLRDKLTTFLGIASLALALTFALLLGCLVDLFAECGRPLVGGVLGVAWVLGARRGRICPVQLYLQHLHAKPVIYGERRSATGHCRRSPHHLEGPAGLLTSVCRTRSGVVACWMGVS